MIKLRFLPREKSAYKTVFCDDGTKSQHWNALTEQQTGIIGMFSGHYDCHSSFFRIPVNVETIPVVLNASALPQKREKTQKPINRFRNRLITPPKNVWFPKIRSSLILEWSNQPSDRVAEVQERLVVVSLHSKRGTVAFSSKTRGKKQKKKRDKNRRFLYR